MILVDSSVWIDYLGFNVSKIDQKLDALIHPNNQVVVTGIILQEVLQGIKNSRSFQLIQKLMSHLPFLVPTADTHYLAAEMFKKLAGHGKTPSTVDVLIAALAIQNKLPLFTLDNDFQAIKTHSPLELFV